VALVFGLAGTGLGIAALVRSPTVTTIASPVPSGIYNDAAVGSPHHFLSVAVSASGALKGSVDFVYQDGQVVVDLTFRGVLRHGVATLTPHFTSPEGTLPMPGAIALVASGTTLALGECQNYLAFVSSLAACRFHYAPNGQF